MKTFAREARALRGSVAFVAGDPAVAPIPAEAALGRGLLALGPSLIPDLSAVTQGRGLEPVRPAVLGCAAVRDIPPELPAPPPLSFRAAAVAVMAIRRLPADAEGLSFEWRIGRLFWLPK